ncbi:uncharacterized protein UHO2_00326 [Ustilago hordei]|uniref:uncharacterized protein n=1 Tax=Ustilago hordei TaxID=120017 RepID=UPI001A45723E|nr:uncharacterized protein UHO2_00326 [Ustilago hordei]SYW81821.1 uncharacterized protein UHO2_00326 [Ustilago hordei]
MVHFSTKQDQLNSIIQTLEVSLPTELDQYAEELQNLDFDMDDYDSSVMGLNAQEAGGSLVHMEGAQEDQAHMRGGPGTAMKRTKLKEHADSYHSGAQETRVKGTVTSQRRRSSV